ncbi:MAG TPA: phosphoglucomutase/phosphomannomutase family protein [Candidatus Wallbacteria bacterium]|nr:phosphoglucomutase/phosphomannomutase family protein [Candidatus Wallbacteria bacterium]
MKKNGIEKIKFGTDGFRGIIAKNFTFYEVDVIVHAIAEYIYSEKLNALVNVCYDRRFMSDLFAARVCETLHTLGISTALSNSPVPTPALSYIMRNSKAGLGIMVTASHNSYEYNGIKIKTRDGASAPGNVISSVQKIIDGYAEAGFESDKIRKKLGISKSGTGVKIDPLPAYLENIKKSVDIEKIRSFSKKILINPMHGSQAGLFKRFTHMAGLRLESEEIFSDHNPLFPGFNPEPILPNLMLMSSYMNRMAMDSPFFAGFAFDGDGDRIAAMTSNGGFVSPQSVFSILLYHLAKNKGARGGIAKTVSVTSLVSAIASKYDLKINETPIGFKYIADLMLSPEHGIAIGGEESGGIGLSHYMPERDGLFLAMMLLEVMAYENKSLEELLALLEKEFGAFHYDRDDYRLSEKKFAEIKQKLSTEKFVSILNKKVERLIDTDGYKYFLADGSWILFRFSGTEPVLRIYAESHEMPFTKALLNFAKEELELCAV